MAPFGFVICKVLILLWNPFNKKIESSEQQGQHTLFPHSKTTWLYTEINYTNFGVHCAYESHKSLAT